MSVVDEYLSKVTPAQKKELERVRKIIQETAPDAEEYISYGMPTYKYKGKYLMAFAVLKNNMSLFPSKLKFTEGKPLPDTVIKDAVIAQMKEIDG